MYSKPRVIVLDSAIKGIQGNDKPPLHYLETATGIRVSTISAYEADE